tara:strand:+ start:31181 stop:31498 length:318 start_codon:yes stop_codon:yes gene_type:complete
MDSYNKQYTKAIHTVISAIQKGNNIIICGPKNSGKTHIHTTISKILKEKNYFSYSSMQSFNSFNKLNGRTFYTDKFWIEENDKTQLSDILDNYEYIETKLIYSDL